MSSSLERVQIVDENNQEIGECPRHEMRSRKLTHRASYILVFNARKELFVQKRTQTKDIYPGYFDIAAGGVVLAGESYENSASRELFEELGVEAELTSLFDHYYADDTNKVWGRVFACRHEGPFVLQKEEVESGSFRPIDSIIGQSHKNRYTPDGIAILRKIVVSELPLWTAQH